MLIIKIPTFRDKKSQLVKYFSRIKLYEYMNNSKPYLKGFSDFKRSDFNFNTITINTFPELNDPDHYNNCFIFRDTLLEAIKLITKKEVYKLVLITPNYSSINDYYGVAYLDGKIVFTVIFENTPAFETWFATTIRDDDENNYNNPVSLIYEFSNSNYSSQPISNLKTLNFEDNTGAFIAHFIPNQFIAEQLGNEKTEFLSPYITLNVTYNSNNIKASFDTLVEKKNLTISPPKDNTTVYEAFKNKAGFDFPEILKSFLSLHNGIKNTAFMSAEAIVSEWTNWKEIYDDWTQDELLDNYSTNQGKALLMYTTPYWIPFFDLQNGNFLAIDFAPNTKGTPGQIIKFGADQEIGYIQDKNLNSFLLNLANDQTDIEDFEWLYTA